MQKMSERIKVFLCHSHDDKKIVRQLYEKLVADGYDAWLDEKSLLPGQDWDIEIRKAVRSSHVVIVCLSNNSVSKEGYIQKEIRAALDVANEKPDGTIFLVPLRLENCEVPESLSKWQWVDLFDGTGYEKLTASLNIRQAEHNAKLAVEKNETAVKIYSPTDIWKTKPSVDEILEGNNIFDRILEFNAKNRTIITKLPDQEIYTFRDAKNWFLNLDTNLKKKIDFGALIRTYHNEESMNIFQGIFDDKFSCFKVRHLQVNRIDGLLHNEFGDTHVIIFSNNPLRIQTLRENLIKNASYRLTAVSRDEKQEEEN